jgi:hypothetical protein
MCLLFVASDGMSPSAPLEPRGTDGDNSMILKADGQHEEQELTSSRH